ncbi:MAG: rRNA (cytosine967-C5)-methyltransferase [Thermoanaerobaculia bacterium]|jgi:16S rRNA (cytosine967-C5)-methyltransferase|nr:rRNA (cytosine967-C5)-methyltransferase [Thermoanaerobaculia bacterium]
MNERRRALELLRRIERESAFASLLLTNDSGFVRTLVLGVLRWRSRLDFVIDSFATSKIEPEIRDILRLGALQLLFMRVAPHAAVGETVALVPLRARGFVNAILRKISKGAPEPADVATRTAHPQWLIDRWTRFYGAERAAKIAEANQELSYPDAMTDSPPADATRSALVPGMWKLTGSSADVDGFALDEGSAVIADIAAAAGSEVLDLAAAPGGKSLVMRARGARVVSNDVSIARLRPLMRRSVSIVVSDGRMPPFARQFQVVLLDAPCSATGTIRKNPEIKWRLREDDLASFVELQKELLSSALDLASETVVFSTCSLELEENDAVVDEILRTRTDFIRGDVAKLVNENVARWVENGVLRLTPEAGTDGFTAHVLFNIRRRGITGDPDGSLRAPSG